ncbi:MAG: hypothetical protein AAGA54_12810 [Myxococcota bacterium]
MLLRTRASAALWLALSGCADAPFFSCDDDPQCQLAGAQGRCVDGECAYPDPACPSGLRFPAVARPAVAGTCVDPGGTGSTSTTGSTTTPPSTSSGSGSGSGSTSVTTEASSSSGGPIPSTCAIDELAGGDAFTCARLDGGVWCWGANDGLQLGREGDGGPTPTQIAALADLDVIHLSAGDDHACAVVEDGGVWCWGRQVNTEVVGSGNTVDLLPTLVPVTDVEAVAVGQNYTCAARGDDVRCWGDTFWGQTGADAGAGFNTLPVRGPIRSIKAGTLHGCLQSSDDRLLCWGRDDQGQLGRGSPPDGQHRPTVEPGPPLILTEAVDDYALGSTLSCALVGGNTWCWGLEQTFELLGAGSSGTPVPLDGVPDAVELAAGDTFACVRSDPGRIACWGSNDFGQSDPQNVDLTLGVADVSAALEAVTGETLRATRLGTGAEHACLATKDRVACWGRGDAGQLGDVPVTDAVAFVSLPGCG